MVLVSAHSSKNLCNAGRTEPTMCKVGLHSTLFISAWNMTRDLVWMLQIKLKGIDDDRMDSLFSGLELNENDGLV